MFDTKRKAMRRVSASPFWVGLSLVSLVIAGCTKNSKPKGPKLDLTPVSGTVTLDGKPLADAAVSFALQGPAPEGFFGSGGATDAQGHYELQTTGQKGTVAGSYKVTISKQVNASGIAVKPEEGMDMGQFQAAGALKETIPPRYSDGANTELTTTVDKGKADGYNFDLKSS